MVVISVYTYGVKIIKRFRWESGFLWGFHRTPRYALTEVQLSVKVSRASLTSLICSVGLVLGWTSFWLVKLAELAFG